jgi:cytochrome P450
MSHATAPLLECDRHIPSLNQPLPLRIWRGLRDPLGFLCELEAKFGDIVMLREGRSYAVFHPDYVRHILQDHHSNYEKGPKYRAAIRPLMGNGLFNSEGPFWLRQRRLVQPAFQRRHLDALAGPVLGCIAETLEAWADKARLNQPVALREELADLTVRIALRNLFGIEAKEHLDRLIPAISVANDHTKLGSVFLPFHLPDWTPTPEKLRFRRSIRTIDEFAYRVIRERRARPDNRVDLLALLLGARDEATGEQMDDLQVRDELVTMLNAGSDSISEALTWTLVLLAQHPEHQERARSEVARVLHGEPATVSSLSEMPLLGCIFHESLRLYPPAWVFARTAIAEDRIGRCKIPAGALVIVSPYVMHRSRRFWDEPGLFNPDRFLPERVEARQKSLYLPFGAGPHMCVGASLAATEVPLILVAILQRFKFELAVRKPVTPDPRISLRPKGTVWLRLRSLAGSSAHA